jgi:hypothetical protein
MALCFILTGLIPYNNLPRVSRAKAYVLYLWINVHRIVAGIICYPQFPLTASMLRNGNGEAHFVAGTARIDFSVRERCSRTYYGSVRVEKLKSQSHRQRSRNSKHGMKPRAGYRYFSSMKASGSADVFGNRIAFVKGN